MNSATPKPDLPPLWSGRPTTLDRSSSGGCCSRCNEIKELLTAASSSSLPPICADCQDGAAPIQIIKPKT